MEKEKLHFETDNDFTGANWNEVDDDYTQHFYEQNLSQFWRPEDISLQPDLNVWGILPDNIKDTYAKNLMVLTFLDTHQGDIGMPVVSRAITDDKHQQKAVLNFMAAMENAVHAKSYSNIFMTYMTTPEINDLFEWGENHPNLRRIMNLIVGAYEALDRQNYYRKYKHEDYKPELFEIVKWQAMVASVFLETWLFYSGFYYPLYFYGQGKLMQAGEIINLILRDESVHGLYVGRLAQDIFDKFPKNVQVAQEAWMNKLLLTLFDEQYGLISSMYDQVGLTDDVIRFVKYNANKALMNLGFDPHFPNEPVNPVVLNGLNTETKTHDYFSMKGTGYQKMVTEAISDDDFDF